MQLPALFARNHEEITAAALTERHLLGAQIESHEHGHGIYRGEIAAIEADEDEIRIICTWVAVPTYDKTSGQVSWHKTETKPVVVIHNHVPGHCTPWGRIWIGTTFGHCIIYPKGDAQLDPGNVR